MSNINRNYTVALDLTTGEVRCSRDIRFKSTDVGTSTINVKLVPKCKDRDLAIKLVVKTSKGELLQIEKKADITLTDFNLDSRFNTDVGIYKCELLVTQTVRGDKKVLTSDEFQYTVEKALIG